jgi:hypothetical protein
MTTKGGARAASFAGRVREKRSGGTAEVEEKSFLSFLARTCVFSFWAETRLVARARGGTGFSPSRLPAPRAANPGETPQRSETQASGVIFFDRLTVCHDICRFTVTLSASLHVRAIKRMVALLGCARLLSHGRIELCLSVPDLATLGA